MRIAADAPKPTVWFRPTAADSRAPAIKQASLKALRAQAAPLRMLPWPQFLLAIQRRRDQAVRAHVRWCMRAAIRSCESLKRAEGRCFELRPGGRGNVVASGGMYHNHNGRHSNGLWPTDGAGERLLGLDSRIMLDSSRYLGELDENLRRLLCPPWAIPVVKRAIRAKLALGWGLDTDAELE